MGNFTPSNINQAITIVLEKWLDQFTSDVKSASSKHQRAKRVRITSGSRVRGFRASINIQGKNAHLALDYSFQVPIGGLPPPPGYHAWYLSNKPSIEGKPNFKSRIYKNLGGQTITRRGFVAIEVERRFTKGSIRRLTNSLSEAIALSLANEIADSFTKKGMRAEVSWASRLGGLRK